MRSQRYRLNILTLAIINHDGQNCPTTIPSGAVIQVITGPLQGDRLIDVKWDGKTGMMFTTDIRGVGLDEV